MRTIQTEFRATIVSTNVIVGSEVTFFFGILNIVAAVAGSGAISFASAISAVIVIRTIVTFF